MKPFGSFCKPFAYGLLAALALGATSAQAAQSAAVVRDVRGAGQVSANGSEWNPAEEGQRLRSGFYARTSSGSTVDLFLGEAAGVVRVMPQSDLAINKLNLGGASIGSMVEVELDLRSGRIVGLVPRLAADSVYEVVIPQGIVGIRGTEGETEYDINASGVVHIAAGRAVVVYANPQDPGNPTVVSLEAGQTAFPPSEPGALVEAQETVEDVSNQLANVFQSLQSARVTYVTVPNPPAPTGVFGEPGPPPAVQITTTTPRQATFVAPRIAAEPEPVVSPVVGVD